MLIPQRYEKNIFGATGVHGTKNSVALYHHRKKYVCFCLQYYCMGLRKKSIDTWPLPKKLVSHYSTIMVNVTWKTFNQTRSLPKTKVGYNTTMVHGTWKKLSRRWYPTEKICFRFRLQYCFDSWDFRKSISLDHHRKKSTFVSHYSTTVVHSTYTTFNRHLTSPKKKMFIATVLLCFTRPRNYCLVSW